MGTPKLTYWGERGFARSMALCIGAEASGEYPTQDKHTPEDDSDFINGFNLGKRVFENEGFEVALSYMNEADQHKIEVAAKLGRAKGPEL